MKAGRAVFLEAGLIAIACAAPAVFGAVHLPSLYFLCTSIFLLVFLFPESLFRISALPRPFAVLQTGLFSGIVLQLVFFSVAPWATGRELLKWFAFACGFLLIQELSKEAAIRWLKLIAILGGVEAFYGAMEVWSGHEHVLWREKALHAGYLTGTYLNRNHLAGFLELALGVQLGLAFEAFLSQKTAKGIFWTVLFFFCFLALLGTGSRAGFASFAVALIFFLPLLMPRFGKIGRAIPLFLGVLLLAVLTQSRVLYERILEAIVRPGGAWGGRLVAWQDTLLMIKANRWTGTGLGSFEWAFPHYQSRVLSSGWMHAHQDYLELAAGLGLLLFSVLVISFVVLFATALKKLFTSSNSSFVLGWGAMLGVFSLLLHGLTDFNFAIPANALLWCLLLSMAYRLGWCHE